MTKPSSQILRDFARAAGVNNGGLWRVIAQMERNEQREKGPTP